MRLLNQAKGFLNQKVSVEKAGWRSSLGDLAQNAPHDRTEGAKQVPKGEPIGSQVGVFEPRDQ